MLKTINDLPEGVIGFEADGKIEASDYENTLIPTVEAASGSPHGVRMVLVFPQWDGMSGDAMWDDLKLGVDHLRTWKRIALVTDVEWMVHLTKLFGWMTPGQMKTFPMSDRDAAVAWAAADGD